MSRRKTTWLAHWLMTGTRMVSGGDHHVYLKVIVDNPASEAGRPVELHLTPEAARHLADRLYRNADQADELTK